MIVGACDTGSVPWSNHATTPQYDVDPAGQRFLMLLDSGAVDGGAVLRPQITVVLNWFEELNERVPVN